jgi:hypothetical protein
VAEIRKLSVGKVLDKVRSNDASEASEMARLDEKSKALDEEIKRLRAARRRLERDQHDDSARGD